MNFLCRLCIQVIDALPRARDKSQAVVSLTLQDIKKDLLPARHLTACALPSPDDRSEVENHRSGGNTDQAATLRSQYLGKDAGGLRYGENHKCDGLLAHSHAFQA